MFHSRHGGKTGFLLHRALAAAVTAAPLLGSVRSAAAADDQQGVASSRMSYSRFLEYLDMGRVKKVGGALRVFCISLFNFMRALWSWSVG